MRFPSFLIHGKRRIGSIYSLILSLLLFATDFFTTIQKYNFDDAKINVECERNFPRRIAQFFGAWHDRNIKSGYHVRVEHAEKKTTSGLEP